MIRPREVTQLCAGQPPGEYLAAVTVHDRNQVEEPGCAGAMSGPAPRVRDLGTGPDSDTRQGVVPAIGGLSFSLAAVAPNNVPIPRPRKR